MQKLLFLGLRGIQNLKTIYCHILVESLRVWQRRFKDLKDLKNSGIPGWLFSAIKSIRKDGNNGKFRKPHFNGK